MKVSRTHHVTKAGQLKKNPEKPSYVYGWEGETKRTRVLSIVVEDIFGDDLPTGFTKKSTQEKEKILRQAVKRMNDEGNYNMYILRKEGKGGFADPY